MKPTGQPASDAMARSLLQASFWPRSWSLSERNVLLMVGDVAIVILSMLVTQYVAGTLETSSYRPLLWVLVLIIVWMIVARGLNAYDLVLASQARTALPRISMVGALAIGIYSIIPYWSPPLAASRSVVVLQLLLLFVPLLAWRLAYTVVFTRPRFRIRVLIVGKGRTIRAVAEMIQDKARREYELVGLIDHRRADRGETQPAERLTDLVTTHGVQEVIVDASSHRSPRLEAALLELAEQGIRVADAAEMYESLTGRIMLPLATSLAPSLLNSASTVHNTVARLADIVTSSVGLVLLTPVLILAAVAVVLDSPGGPLYRQERVGRYGRVFKLIKLRTMVQHAEADGRAVWAQYQDPRVTRVGAYLRRSRLDEAPQLWHVLMGQMSLIGPRPERPEFVEMLGSKIPLYRARHVIRPGITGWAQVQFKYGSSIPDSLTKLQYDLYYIRHRSFFLDAVILLKTLFVILRLKGT